MTHTSDIVRPARELVDAVAAVGSATASATLHRMGIRNAHITGPVAWTPGRAMAGPALTLQFMPLREDVYEDTEYVNVEKQLHRHVMYHAQQGDIIVVDARASMSSGVFGDMMMTYFKGRGGAGVVIDGCLRDWPKIRELGIGCWIRGVTPNYHTQTELFPYAVNVPIACGGCYVAPGDIIVADDDGAVVVPVSFAERMIERANRHHEWEEFSRIRLSEGGDLRRYYPLHADAEPEFRAWQAEQSTGE
ncbi:MAG: ribonuclease activity regulator RraA [Geminicoccaceae bacterium]|nr:ribonuclease activity regulator RraA [Geminicoccaceae bacterium]